MLARPKIFLSAPGHRSSELFGLHIRRQETSGMKYHVMETTEVTAETIEQLLNRCTEKGWRFEGMHFVVKESARRPSMAFLLFTQSDKDEVPPGE
jgi:hypothetical protein